MRSSSKQLTSAIIAALFFATALVVYFEMILPSYATLQNDKGQELSEQALYQNEQQIVSSTQMLIQAYSTEASSTSAVSMALPVGQNTADALAQLYGIAENTGFTIQGTTVNVQAVKAATTAGSANITSAAVKGGSIVRPTGSISFQLTGNGSYESFKNFLTGLEDNIRLFDVTGISIQPVVSGKGGSDLFNYTISVTTYYQSS